MLLLLQILSISVVGAYASLGGSTDSIEADRAQVHGQRQNAESHPSYSVEIISSNAMVVREYVSTSSGKIFAIAWKGSHHPDLTQLLGKYFPEFSAANQKAVPIAKENRRVRGRVSQSVIESDNVVVEKGGHMRAARGRAYVTKLFPAGVTSNDIQ